MSIFSQRSRSSYKQKVSTAGFTLIELLVVLAIMVIMTSFLLIRQSRFNSSTLLRSPAYSVALSVRQSQAYGTASFGTTTSITNCATGTYQNSACFVKGYGIYVNFGSSNPTSYTLFADFNNNGTYDDGEVVKVFNLGNGYSVSKICAAAGATQYCNTNAGVTWLSILFRRPNPDACFTTNLSSSACATSPSGVVYSSGSIQIQSNGGDAGTTRSINVNTTGQISVGNVGT